MWSADTAIEHLIFIELWQKPFNTSFVIPKLMKSTFLAKISFVFILSLLLPLALAELPVDFSAINQEQVDLLAEEYQNVEMPGSLGKLFGNVRINTYLALNNGQQLVLGIATENKMLSTVQLQEIDNPSLRIDVTEATLREILESQNPLPLLKKALDDGKIKYTGVGFKNKLKFGGLAAFLTIAGWFTSEETSEDNGMTFAAVAVLPPAPEIAPEPAEPPNTTLPAEPEPLPAVKDHPVVELIDGGFSVAELTIKVGDTVEWKNTRTGRYKQAMVIGMQQCAKLRSSMFLSGQSYNWTFNEKMVCIVADGIYTKQTMKVIVK